MNKEKFETAAQGASDTLYEFKIISETVRRECEQLTRRNMILESKIEDLQDAFADIAASMVSNTASAETVTSAAVTLGEAQEPKSETVCRPGRGFVPHDFSE